MNGLEIETALEKVKDCETVHIFTKDNFIRVAKYSDILNFPAENSLYLVLEKRYISYDFITCISQFI